MSVHPLTKAYEEILEIAHRQLEALTAADVDRFLTLQGERDARFAAAERASAKDGVPAGDSPNGSLQRAALEAVLRSLPEIDAQLVRLLSAQMKTTQEEISRLHQGRRAIGCYGMRVDSRALLLDENR